MGSSFMGRDLLSKELMPRKSHARVHIVTVFCLWTKTFLKIVTFAVTIMVVVR